MLSSEERERLNELTKTMTERPLDSEESAEMGTLMAVDLGASRDVPEPPQLHRRRPQAAAAGRGKHKRRRR